MGGWPAQVLRGSLPAAGLWGGTCACLLASLCEELLTPKATSPLPTGPGEQFPLTPTRLVLILALCPGPHPVNLCMMNDDPPHTPHNPVLSLVQVTSLHFLLLLVLNPVFPLVTWFLHPWQG